MITPRLFERLPMISVHPESATREDIAELAAELMESRRDLLASQAEVATLRREREQYRVQVEERYGAVAQWREQAEINRQAWLKAQYHLAVVKRLLLQGATDDALAELEGVDAAAVLRSRTLAAVQAAPAPQE